jgi:hypothetical protein
MERPASDTSALRGLARRRLPPLALALAAGAAAVSAAGADELKPYQAAYHGIWHGMTVAASELKLEHTGDTWTFSSSSSPRGIGRMASGIFPPRQVSVVHVTAGGVRPQSYKFIGGDESKTTALTYDWQKQRVTGSYEGTPVDQPLTPKMQDDASVQLALMVELIAGRTPTGFQLIDKNSVREYDFKRDGTATLQTPIGAIATVIYAAQKANSPRITRFWCAPDRGYVPLKVEQTKGSDVQWTMLIQRLTRD